MEMNSYVAQGNNQLVNLFVSIPEDTIPYQLVIKVAVVDVIIANNLRQSISFEYNQEELRVELRGNLLREVAKIFISINYKYQGNNK